MLRIRNPWGQGEWKGKWGDGSPEWDKATMTSLKYHFEDDGTFWMEWSDFIEQYNRVYFLRLFDNEWKYDFKESAWKGNSAGGCGKLLSSISILFHNYRLYIRRTNSLEEQSL